MTENITCKIKINRIFYPHKSSIKSGDWGIISCSLQELIDGEPILDKNDSFVVKGIMPEINMYDTYKLIGKLTNDNKYGYQYEVVYLNTDYNLTDKDEQRIFLSHILTENQIEELYKTFPDPFIIIQEEDIEALTKIKGIGVHTAQRIIFKYRDNIDNSKLFVKLDGYGLTQNMINKLIEQYSSPDVIIDKITKNPYILAEEIDGIGWKKADSIALKSGIEKNSVYRIQAYIIYYLTKQSENGNSWVYPSDLLYAVEELLEEEIDQDYFKTIIYSMYENEEIYWDDSKTFICLKKLYELENNIKDELLRLLNRENNFDYKNYQLIINSLEKEQSWEYSDEQKKAIKLVLNNNVSIITGGSGTGKSTVAKAIITILKNYSFAQCSLSGKAAARLTEVTGQTGYTIHKLLEYNPKCGFGHTKNHPLEEDIIILDETSMVGGDLFYQLLQAIKDGAKLIMLGDPGQLEAIGLANVFKDMIDSGVIPVAHLNQIHRQAQKSAIITNSRQLRKGEQIVKEGWTGVEVRGELQDLILDIYEDKLFTAKKIMEWFEKEITNNNIFDVQIIVPIKERGDSCTYELNNEIQSYYNPSTNSKNQIDIKENKRIYILREGDKVINIKNNYKTINENGIITPIFNGYIGIIKEIDEECMIIDFELCGKIIIEKKFWNSIKLGYAITCHKGEGSEWQTIIVGLDYSAYTLLTKEWAYTAITRAKKKCILCAENSALRYATTHSNIATKQTFLSYMLKNNPTKL